MAQDAWIHVVVRDGRVRREPALMNEERGEVLMEFDASRLYGRGEPLTLPDGSEVEVIGAEWDTGPVERVDGAIRPTGQTTQTVYVRNV